MAELHKSCTIQVKTGNVSEPKGMESEYNRYSCLVLAGHTIPCRQLARYTVIINKWECVHTIAINGSYHRCCRVLPVT